VVAQCSREASTMPQLVDHLAELTGLRDRDVLDVTLVGALKDLLQPVSVAIYRCIGEAGNQRWLTRARLGSNDVVATADPLWADLQTLPRIERHTARFEAFQRQSAVMVAGATQLAVFSLANDREVVGVLEIETTRALDDPAQRLVGSILRIYRNFQGLLDYSERDTLTGLLNRKTFDESFLKATAESGAGPAAAPDGRRAAGPAGNYRIGVIDIDHFKRVNDNFGHLIGDEVLLLLSRLMRGSFRFHDRLYRFGGEEFVVLMRCSSNADAALALERLRYNTERYEFPQVGHITVSIGFTEVCAGDTPARAFERADKAVYYAKGNGRNQIQSHADLVARGELHDNANVGDVELF
jgi:diguanylate cyclase (GGDEF)-like protein